MNQAVILWVKVYWTFFTLLLESFLLDYRLFVYHNKSLPQIGRISPVFADASAIAASIMQSGFIYDLGEIYYNKYFSAVKYELTVIPVFHKDKIEVRLKFST